MPITDAPIAPSRFSSLGLRPELIEATAHLGYAFMTPIQAQALPPILAGRDVVAQAKTGSGKTAAFGLGLLQALDRDALAVQALVLSPTRELAEQVAEALRQLAQRLANTRVLTLCGGRPVRSQQSALSQGVHVVVGTPGRVADHLQRGTLDLSELRTVVLDEADRMLDMGFVEEVSGILEQCPRPRQTLLFSATLPERIDLLSADTQVDPVAVRVESRVAAADLRQIVVRCPHRARYEAVARVLGHFAPSSALVFCETRQDVEGLWGFLAGLGASVRALHGGLEQRERDDVLVQFANGSARFLVATDVAARGLDIPALPMVVQAELARDPAVHIHRIGRTARAGERGLAVCVVAGDGEARRLAALEAVHGTLAKAPSLPTHRPTFQPSENRTLLLLAGRRDKLRKGDVVGALVKQGGLPPDAIGDIHLSARTCAVAIRREHATTALRSVRHGRIKKIRVRASLLGD